MSICDEACSIYRVGFFLSKYFLTIHFKSIDTPKDTQAPSPAKNIVVNIDVNGMNVIVNNVPPAVPATIWLFIVYIYFTN